MDLEKERTDGEGKKTIMRKLHLGRVRVSLEDEDSEANPTCLTSWVLPSTFPLLGCISRKFFDEWIFHLMSVLSLSRSLRPQEQGEEHPSLWGSKHSPNPDLEFGGIEKAR